ncbi:hypothetical protein [Williamsia herbipolensis]|uniref:hypothetical protein n=1 Tax=Williamsia herbipolensis TaxID=1603258 RepID=UPI0005F7E7E2|nr:hypothetical protein [Williamsia herbipolensis]
MSSKTEWETAEKAVDTAADKLKAMTTHTELYGWAKDNKLDSRALWPKAKTVMRQRLGIDYNAIRERVTAERAAEVAAAATDAPEIELWSAGDAEVASFAVCDATGEQSWYGEFRSDDRIYAFDDLSAELSAADKAVFIAGKAREHAELSTIRLLLHTCHPDLDPADLAATASRHRVALSIDVDDQSPAVALCRAPGSHGWRDIRLDILLEAGDTEQAAA